MSCFKYGVVILSNPIRCYIGIQCPNCNSINLKLFAGKYHTIIKRLLIENIDLTYYLIKNSIYDNITWRRINGLYSPCIPKRLNVEDPDRLLLYEKETFFDTSNNTKENKCLYDIDKNWKVLINTFKKYKLKYFPYPYNPEIYCEDMGIKSYFKTYNINQPSDCDLDLVFEEIRDRSDIILLSHKTSTRKSCDNDSYLSSEYFVDFDTLGRIDSLFLTYSSVYSSFTWENFTGHSVLFRENDLQEIIKIEREHKIRIIPRYFYSSKLRDKIDNLMWYNHNNLLKYDDEYSYLNKWSEQKDGIMKNFLFLEILASKDDPYETDTDYYKALIKADFVNSYKKIIKKLESIDISREYLFYMNPDEFEIINYTWANFNSIKVQNLLEMLRSQFIIDYLKLIVEKISSDIDLAELISRYIIKISDAMNTQSVYKVVEEGAIKEQIDLKNYNSKRYNWPKIITNDFKFLKTINAIPEQLKKKKNDLIFIEGETGTGKELIAKAVHNASERTGEIITVNCAEIQKELANSELFGIVKGTATGVDPRLGKIEAAHLGTIFLDEIGKLDIDIQGKLLRVIENRTITPVGSSVSRPFDAMIIIATNIDLWQLHREGKFLNDLIYRIEHSIPINIPPLRARKGDIPLLISYFLEKEILENFDETEKVNLEFDDQTMKILQKFNWEGNVRQLMGFISRVVAFFRIDKLGPVINYKDLPIEKFGRYFGVGPEDIERSEECIYEFPTGFSKEKNDQDILLSLIRKKLILSQGNRENTARALGISPPTLWRRIKDFEKIGIDVFEGTGLTRSNRGRKSSDK